MISELTKQAAFNANAPTFYDVVIVLIQNTVEVDLHFSLNICCCLLGVYNIFNKT